MVMIPRLASGPVQVGVCRHGSRLGQLRTDLPSGLKGLVGTG